MYMLLRFQNNIFFCLFVSIPIKYYYTLNIYKFITNSEHRKKYLINHQHPENREKIFCIVPEHESKVVKMYRQAILEKNLIEIILENQL